MFQSTLKVGFVYVALLAALAVTTVQAQNSSVKTSVLVHGAWARRRMPAARSGTRVVGLAHLTYIPTTVILPLCRLPQSSKTTISS